MRKKTAAELEEEYKKAEARAKALKEKALKASVAEEAKKKAQLLHLVLEWASLNYNINDIDRVIEIFSREVNKKQQNRND